MNGTFFTVLFLLVVANGTPVLTARLLGNRAKHRIDFGTQLPDGHGLFGSSKTWRGLLAALVTEILAEVERPDMPRTWELTRDVPGVALRTTVMVGFPGEGKKEFGELLGFLRNHPFENLGAFVFSQKAFHFVACVIARFVECR